MARRKVWPLLVAVLVEDHAHGEAGPLLALPAASTGRWRSAPAASARRGRGSRPSCRACCASRSSRRARAHVVGDVGDGDVHDPAAAVAGIGVGRGVHGIVVVARVDGIDGERGRARAGRCGPASVGGSSFAASASTAAGKLVGDAVRVHGDQADLALVLRDCRASRRRAPAARRSGPSARDRSAPDRRPWRRPHRPARSAIPSAPCGRRDR